MYGEVKNPPAAAADSEATGRAISEDWYPGAYGALLAMYGGLWHAYQTALIDARRNESLERIDR